MTPATSEKLASIIKNLAQNKKKKVSLTVNDTIKPELVTLIIDSVALTYAANYGLSLKRPKFLQDDLGDDYKGLLSSKVKI